MNYWNIKLGRELLDVQCIPFSFFVGNLIRQISLPTFDDFHEQFELFYDENMRCSPGNSFSQ